MDVMKNTKLTTEQKAEIIEAARFAHAESKDPLMSDKEWEIFRKLVNRNAQARTVEEFKQRQGKGEPQAN